MRSVRGTGTFLLRELVRIIGLISFVSFSDVNESLKVSVNVKQLLKCNFGVKYRINPNGSISPLFGDVYLYVIVLLFIYASRF